VNARSKATEVVLTHGQIKLFTNINGQASAFMQPGDKWKLDTLNDQFIKTKINSQLYSAWTERKWIFQKTSLNEIAVLIKEYYGVDLVLEKEKDKELTISAVIPVTSLGELIPVMEETLGIIISSSNNKLIVH
jgi:ferric-dicitrate binding protein FerR (iron transport regulator)